jgi:valyl-tRNA synthetase
LPQEESFLAVAAWPGYDASKIDSEAERSVELLQEIVAHIRQMRAESNIDPGRRIEVLLLGGDAQSGRVLETQSRLIAQLVRAGELKIVDRFADDLVAVRGVVRNLRVAIPLAGVLDVDAERKRVLKDLARVEQQLELRSRRLNDPQFVERAPAIVVQKERQVQQDLLDRKGRLDENLASLGRP